MFIFYLVTFVVDGLLHDWVAGLSSDSTVVVVVLGHPDVAFLSPRCSPGVLDDPVLSVPGEDSALRSVPYDQHSVVQAGGGAEQRLVHSCNSALQPFQTMLLLQTNLLISIVNASRTRSYTYVTFNNELIDVI